MLFADSRNNLNLINEAVNSYCTDFAVSGSLQQTHFVPVGVHRRQYQGNQPARSLNSLILR